MTFDEWMTSYYHGADEGVVIDPQDVWNAALDEAIRVVNSTLGAESSIENTIVLITTELEFLKS